jgi:hypothetical protein
MSIHANNLVPLVIDSFGRYGPQLSLFLKHLFTIDNKQLTLTDGEAPHQRDA